MERYRNATYLQNMIDDLRIEALRLQPGMQNDVYEVISRFQSSLESPGNNKAHLTLFLSSVRQRVERLEHQSLQRLLHDEDVLSLEYASLVRIRYLSLSLKNVIKRISDDVKSGRHLEI